MNDLCACGDMIDVQELYSAFKDLFISLDEGTAVASPVEESIYFQSLCVSCAKRFLVDERVGTS